MLVIMALVTTMVTTPLLDVLQGVSELIPSSCKKTEHCVVRQEQTCG